MSKKKPLTDKTKKKKVKKDDKPITYKGSFDDLLGIVAPPIEPQNKNVE